MIKKLDKRYVLVLRTCANDMSAYGGFIWPKRGFVKCPDWRPVKECGNGLHGFLWGQGDGSLASGDIEAKWLVVKVLVKDIVDLESKVKFSKGTVIYCGNKLDATNYIKAFAPKAVNAVIAGTSTSGARGTSTSGARGTSTSGDAGTSTSGAHGTSTSGDAGTSTSGAHGTSTSGARGTSTSGARGTSTSGDAGTSTSGARGTSTSGDAGTSTSGYAGTSTSGARGTSTSGEVGIIVCRWFDGNRYRLVVGYVGEDGIKPNTKYKANQGKLEEVK